MNATDELVRFVRTSVPTVTALSSADNQLAGTRQRLRTSGAAAEDAHPAGSPTAMNRAWRLAIRAAGADGWLPVAAAVLALQHGSREGGDRASEAVAVGNAVADHVAAALRSTSAADRWSHRSVAGAIGAGAGAGRLLALDEIQLRNLFGLCATQAAGLANADDTDAGVLQLAKAAADAVEAAALARHGFTSSADGLTGRRGLFEVLAPGAAWPGGLGAGWGGNDA